MSDILKELRLKETMDFNDDLNQSLADLVDSIRYDLKNRFKINRVLTKPNLIIIYGDTDTAMAGASKLQEKKCKINPCRGWHAIK